MSHITKEEYLSAFLDGESGSFEQQRLSDQLGSDDLMQEKLSNFALLGESMRNQSQPLVVGSSFLAGIQDAIAEDEIEVATDLQDEQVEAPKKIEKKRLFPRQMLGYAMAASVAAVAAVSMQSYFSPESEAPMIAAAPPVVEQASIAKVAQPNMVMQASFKPEATVEAISYSVPDAEMRGLMNQYVAHHFQYASSNTLMPRVRAVSYSTDF